LQTKIPGHNTSKTTVGLIIYFIYLGALTLNPFEFSIAPFRQWLILGIAEKTATIFVFNITDFLLNILLFIPLGALLFYHTSQKNRPANIKIILHIIGLGALISFGIEFAQLFSDRTASFFDILANTLGTGAGILVFQSFKPANTNRNPNIIRTGVLFLTAFYLFYHLLPAQLNNLLVWDDTFEILIGDEANDSRPWEGEISLAAIYGEALTRENVAALSLDNTTEQRKNLDCIALWNFTKIDTSFIPDLINGPGKIDLYPDNTIEPTADSARIVIQPGSAFRNRSFPYKIVYEAQDTRCFSIEAKFKVHNLAQTGPARIITFSNGKDKRNFTLGQSGKKIHFRVRTPLTGANGSAVCLVSSQLLTKDQDIHLVATFNNGIERLYFNGQLTNQGTFGIADYLPLLARYNDNDFTRFIFLMLVFFPLPFFFVLISKPGSWIPAGFFAILTALATQCFYIISCGQSFDFFYFAAVGAGLLIGLPAGLILKTKKQP